MLSPAPLPLAALVLKALALPKTAMPSPMPNDAATNTNVGPFVAALAAASAVRGQANYARSLPAREPTDRRKRERERDRRR
ncbi:MAG: hypothetical protein IBJ15_05265 [Alphaproteobacteria bacterium]|nr:hypothetical protein [Alphaproteobacteria bacterium]